MTQPVGEARGPRCAAQTLSIICSRRSRRYKAISSKASWPPATADDLKRAANLTEFFRKHIPGEKNEAHYGVIDPACPSSRFRPEDVAASLKGGASAGAIRRNKAALRRTGSRS